MSLHYLGKHEAQKLCLISHVVYMLYSQQVQMKIDKKCHVY